VRTVRYERQAEAALDTARALYKRVDDIVMGLEWAIIHDDRAGLSLGGSLRLFVFDRIRSAGMPRVECFLEYQGGDLVIIHDLEFS
jgi:hypothetical protein